MSYPYGATVPPTLPDLPYTVLQRRQGDVKATLIPITLNGQPINISGFTFIFSVNLPSGLQTVTWTVNAPSTGNAITTVDVPGFTVPNFNASVSVPFVSTLGMNAGDQVLVLGFGVYTIQTVTSLTNAILLNTGLQGNPFSGSVPATTNVYEIGQVGMTVLVIPAVITNVAVGLYPCYCKYTTADSFPGPYTMTFLQGALQILLQNDPNG
jgi:hypothetical protein